VLNQVQDPFQSHLPPERARRRPRARRRRLRARRRAAGRLRSLCLGRRSSSLDADGGGRGAAVGRGGRGAAVGRDGGRDGGRGAAVGRGGRGAAVGRGRGRARRVAQLAGARRALRALFGRQARQARPRRKVALGVALQEGAHDVVLAAQLDLKGAQHADEATLLPHVGDVEEALALRGRQLVPIRRGEERGARGPGAAAEDVAGVEVEVATAGGGVGGNERAAALEHQAVGVEPPPGGLLRAVLEVARGEHLFGQGRRGAGGGINPVARERPSHELARVLRLDAPGHKRPRVWGARVLHLGRALVRDPRLMGLPRGRSAARGGARFWRILGSSCFGSYCVREAGHLNSLPFSLFLTVAFFRAIWIEWPQVRCSRS
jgi:hypothetical protein